MEIIKYNGKKKKNRLSRFQIMLVYFCIYAFLGWLMETAYAYYLLGHFVKRGFLFGPLCPIYGFGGVILYSLLAKYKKNSLKLFILSAIVFSVFEYVAGFMIDALFQARWWDYTGEFLNLNGRISIFFSFVWGICAILFINHVHPFVKKKLNLVLKDMPYLLQNILVYLILIVLLVDTFASCVKYLTVTI